MTEAALDVSEVWFLIATSYLFLFFFVDHIIPIGCSFTFIVKVDVEESIVNAPRPLITDHRCDFLRCLCFYSADGRVVRSQSRLQRQRHKFK
jgi:hypothetical protein